MMFIPFSITENKGIKRVAAPEEKIELKCEPGTIKAVTGMITIKTPKISTATDS